jgi:anti-sigma B factor antagonist
MDFQISETHLDNQFILLTLSGRLTAASSPQLRDEFKQLENVANPKVILDMSAVHFLDSSGLAALVSGLKTTRERSGWLRLAGITPQAANIFKLSQLDRVFSIFPSVETALNHS